MIIGVPKGNQKQREPCRNDPCRSSRVGEREVIQCMYRQLPVQTAVFLMKSTLQWVRKCCQPSKLRMPQLK